jgi:hypothetical protein
MKQLNFAAAAAAAALMTGAAYAAPVTFTKLTGVTGTPGGANTAVFKADLTTSGLSAISSLSITDSGVIGASAPGQFSGFDLDAILISTVDCATAACAAALLPTVGVNFGSAGFSPGTQLAPTDPKLFGTDATGAGLDNLVATLGAFDGFSSTLTPSGFISLGVNGSIAFNLLSTVMITGPLFLYIGEVGDNGELAAGGIEVSDSPIPVPGAIPLFLTGLAAAAAARRRKAAA